MKTCLHRLLPIAILSLSSLAQPLSAQTMYDKSQYKNFNDVKIPQPYTPFGNRPEFNRYGDDGSKCVLDANGVLTWIGNKGEVRLLPDSSKGVPLFVTNTECLVWVNRFVDYDTYNDRPDAQLRLYRSTPESNAVTSRDVSFKGKEIIDTPQVTTTTGALTFVSATRKDNKNETVDSDGDEFNYSDDCELRFYRLTFDAGVQFIGSRTVQITNAESFDTNTNGPEIEALGYGSDGSMAFKVINERVQPASTNSSPDYEARTYWIDNQGRFVRVVEDQATLTIVPPATTLNEDPNPCSRVLSVSNTRLVYEHSTTAGVTGIQEQRRSSSTGNLLTGSTKDLTGSVEGTTLDIWNYSQVGVNRYFYTVNTSDEVVGAPDDTGTIIRTYRVTANGISVPVTTTLTGGLTISPATMTGTVNTNDGSALLVTEDGDALIWLHAAGYTALPNSSQANALFVTNDQAVIWENAKAPAGGDGQIPAAVVMHYNRTRLPATPVTISSAIQNATSVTVTATSHGLSVGERITIAGLTGGVPANGTFVVASVIDANKFTYKFDTNQTLTFGLASATSAYGGTVIRTDDNKTLLNTSRLTPDPEYWFFTTAIKTDASTSRLTTYKLGTVEIANEDSDGDGLLDYNEVNPESPTPKTDHKKADTDGDGLLDGYELKESKTKPAVADTDGDGLKDGDEVLTHFTDPLVKDTDGDELTDNEEVTGKATIDGKLVEFTPTKPLEADTDGDYFLDIEELKKGTDPTNNQSRPTSAPLVDNDGTYHDQPKLEENSPNTIKIAQQFSPFGNRSDYNRYGDDGSAMIVDVNGLLIWQDAAGKVREIPNSEQAAPLVVSNIESIVWTNAFADYDTYDEKPVAQVVIYRVDPATGTLSSTPVPLQGKEIVPTAPITSTTEAYSIITSEHGLVLDDNIGLDTVFRLYRITFSGQVQRTGQIEVFGTGTADTAAQHTKAIGHGSDGSIVFTQDGFDLDQDGVPWPNDEWEGIPNSGPRDDYRDRFRRVFWVDGSRFNTSGLWEQLAENTIETNWIDPNDRAVGNLSTQVSRVVYTSKTRVIYEKYKDKVPTLIEARRNSSTGALINDNIPVTPSEPITRILQTSTQTVSGRDKYFYAIGDLDENLLNVFKVTNSGIFGVYSAENDAIGDLDETAFVEKVNPNDGSAVITSDDIKKLLWLHNTGTSDNTKNITELPGSRLGRTMFVDERELVLWANANSPVTGNGRLEPVRIYHYEVSPTDGTLVRPNDGWTNLSYKIAGNFVMNTPPFTPDTTPEPGYWVFSTVEKTGGTTAKVTRYRLLTGKTADDDGDNLSNAEELVPLDGRPFKTSITDPGDPDTDDDGIPDGLEVHPFRIIDGDFSHEEARLDAINRGGRLAVIDSAAKLIQFKKQILSKNAGRRLWLGGGDLEAGNSAELPNSMEGKYHWVNDSGYYFDKTGKRVAVLIKAGDFTNWGGGQPSNVGDLDGIQVEQDFTWSMAALTQRQGYILEVKPTNPVVADSDTDGDGLIDNDERDKYGTDRLKADTDGDALNDGAEISLGTDPRDTDTDNDGLLDGDEVSRGTKPKVLDTDEDGLSDGAEVLTHLTNPLVKDSDGDGISDFDEVTKGSNPNDANNPKNIDTDKEGLKDYEELFVYNTDPTKVDTDGDGLSDYDEVKVYGTDPLLVDTDGDGVDDYREVVILFTDPNGGSFAASSAGSAVSFSEGRGNYGGLLYNSNDGLGYKLTLNVTAKGAFSGSLEGNFGKAPLRGKLMGDGTWSGRITQGNAGFLRMKLAEQDDGSYGVQGSLETPTGGVYYYQARRAIGFPARKLTSEASAIDDAAGPTGSAVATGGIGKGGKVTQQIYNPDGSRATYAGSVLEGEFMALYARTKGGVPTVMLGNVALHNNSDGKSNFDGIVRLFNRNYDQERSLSGAYYSPPTMGTLPLPAMSLTANNAVFSWSDGRFDGVNKVASWMPNKVTVPTTQNDKATPVYDRKTGLLKLTYTRTDPAKGLINAQSNAFAVVVQGKDKLSGFYTGAGSWGGFSVQENSAGLQPDFTNISPLNKTVSAGSISYNVDVTSSGDWTVDTTGASWVTASVKSGTGSGTVVITVNANASNARREASIRIAGFTHTITQSYR
jgi:hypothetical protein